MINNIQLKNILCGAEFEKSIFKLLNATTLTNQDIIVWINVSSVLNIPSVHSNRTINKKTI